MSEFIDWEAECDDSDRELQYFVPTHEDLDMIDDGDISSDSDYVPPNPYLPVSNVLSLFIFSSLSARG